MYLIEQKYVMIIFCASIFRVFSSLSVKCLTAQDYRNQLVAGGLTV